MPLRATFRIATLIAICGAASPLCLAQGPAKDQVLRGPAVQDRDVPGAPSRFGSPSERSDKFHRDPRIAHRQFMDALHSLEDEELAPDLRLTEAELAQIDAIDMEFRDAVKAFKAAHDAEIDALKEKAGDIREERRERGPRSDGGPDGPPTGKPRQGNKNKDKASADPEVAAARAQLKALRDAGPKPEDFHTRMWAVLTAPQQSLVQSRLDDMRDDRGPGGPRGDRPDGSGDRAPRGERGSDGRPHGDGPPDERFRDGPLDEAFRDGPPPPGGRFDHGPRGGERGFGPDGDRGHGFGGRGPGDGPPPLANPRIVHLMDQFNQLPPDAQDRIIDRLEEMLSRMEHRRGRGGPKPPPPFDDVDVPPPAPADEGADAPMPPPAPDHH